MKAHAFANLAGIHERTKALVPGLIWKEFLALPEAANQQSIWEFRNLDAGYLPYILVCCTLIFPATKTGRKNPVFFVLDSSASRDQYWNLPATEAKLIWRVQCNANSQPVSLEATTIVADDSPAWYLTKAKKILGV